MFVGFMKIVCVPDMVTDGTFRPFSLRRFRLVRRDVSTPSADISVVPPLHDILHSMAAIAAPRDGSEAVLLLPATLQASTACRVSIRRCCEARWKIVVHARTDPSIFTVTDDFPQCGHGFVHNSVPPPTVESPMWHSRQRQK